MKQNSHQTSLFELRDLFVRHRELTWAMAKREFTGRYAGQFFGVFWGFAHPAMLIVIYASVFSLVFKVRVGGTREMPLDYTTYLLSGLIPWLAFSESMSRSTGIILEHTSLVKQVAFPIAVLPLKTVISSLITQAVFTIFLLSYVALRHNTFFLTWGLLPVLFIIQGSAMIGLAYMLSSVAVYFRDLKDFVQLFLTAGLFIIPVLYLPTAIPPKARFIFYLNPFGSLVFCYQDTLFFGRFEHPWAWAILTIWSLCSFYLGYRLFRRLKIMFGSVL